MKKRLLGLVLGLCLALGTVGCSSTNITEWQQALAGDQAIVTGQVTSIYGTVKFVRVGKTIEEQKVTVSPDGTVTIDNTNVDDDDVK